MKMNDKYTVNHVDFWLKIISSKLVKICGLANRQIWPTKTYTRTIFWPINNMCENAGSRVSPYFEQNVASFHLVNKTPSKRISYGYHGNASWLPAAKFRGLFGHYYSEGYTICPVRPYGKTEFNQSPRYIIEIKYGACKMCIGWKLFLCVKQNSYVPPSKYSAILHFHRQKWPVLKS